MTSQFSKASKVASSTTNTLQHNTTFASQRSVAMSSFRPQRFGRSKRFSVTENTRAATRVPTASNPYADNSYAIHTSSSIAPIAAVPATSSGPTTASSGSDVWLGAGCDNDTTTASIPFGTRLHLEDEALLQIGAILGPEAFRAYLQQPVANVATTCPVANAATILPPAPKSVEKYPIWYCKNKNAPSLRSDNSMVWTESSYDLTESHTVGLQEPTEDAFPSLKARLNHPKTVNHFHDYRPKTSTSTSSLTPEAPSAPSPKASPVPWWKELGFPHGPKPCKNTMSIGGHGPRVVCIGKGKKPARTIANKTPAPPPAPVVPVVEKPKPIRIAWLPKPTAECSQWTKAHVDQRTEKAKAPFAYPFPVNRSGYTEEELYMKEDDNTRKDNFGYPVYSEHTHIRDDVETVCDDEDWKWMKGDCTAHRPESAPSQICSASSYITNSVGSVLAEIQAVGLKAWASTKAFFGYGRYCK